MIKYGEDAPAAVLLTAREFMQADGSISIINTMTLKLPPPSGREAVIKSAASAASPEGFQAVIKSAASAASLAAQKIVKK